MIAALSHLAMTLLSLFGLCWHPHTYLCNLNGKRTLLCDTCGRKFPGWFRESA